MKTTIFTLLFAILFATFGFSQEGIIKTTFSKDSIITFRVFDTKIKKIDISKSKETIKELVHAGINDDLLLQQTHTDELGYTHYFYLQFYKGVKVENGMYIAHTRNGLMESVNGDFFKISNVEINAKLSESEALAKALNAVKAEVYKWQIEEEELFIKKMKNDNNATYFPKGEKVIFLNNISKTYRLAYKFDVYAHYPLSHNNVFIDAITGELLDIQNQIFDINTSGTADTRYSGTQVITSDLYSGSYRLRELTNSVRIETYNMRTQGARYLNATDFTDNDNNWTAAENDNIYMDNAALDAHWGAEKTYAYWNSIRKVNSWDGSGAPLLSYVHADLVKINPYLYSDNDNAFWDKGRLTYGDGTNIFKPLVSLDIVAHEIGHGFCQGVSIMRGQGTNYILSSGNEALAINEGMSDIWAVCVENWAAPTKQYWQVGEDIMKNGFSCFRSLRSPKTEGYRYSSAEGRYPDTYNGTYWYSGSNTSYFSHINLTVLGHWFYLLAIGGSGTNDLGNVYNISGIGITDAASIAWRAELYYFTANTTFSSARDALIQAASDYFGINSCQVMAVTNAWYAVGVGSPFQLSNVSLSGPSIVCSSGATFSLNNAPSGCSINWTYSSNLAYVSGQGTRNLIVKAIDGTPNNDSIYRISGQKTNIKAGNSRTPQSAELYSNDYGSSGWVSATIVGNPPSTKTIWVGNPSFTPVVTGLTSLYPSQTSLYVEKNNKSVNWSTYGSLKTVGANYGYKCSIKAIENGVGWVYATVSNICGSYTGELMVDVGNSSYSIYPNPTSNEITISQSFNNTLTNNYSTNKSIRSIRLVDKFGNTVYYQKYNDSIFETKINLSNLPIGVYIIKINEDNFMESYTIIKQ